MSNSKNGKCCLYTQGIIRLVVNVKTLPFLIRYIYVTNSVDIKLSVHDAPPEQSALDTLKIERLDRQATHKFLQSYTTNRTAMVTRARGIITEIR
jgi:hypothetical protein